MKILITDCFIRKAYDVYNIVCLHYNKKDIVLTSDSSTAFKGKLIFNYYPYQLRKDKQVNFDIDLNQLLDRYSNDKVVYIPIEEDTTLLLYKFIEKFGCKNLVHNIPSVDYFQLARDKYLLNVFCCKNDIPSPSFYTKENILKGDNEYRPLIIKPRNGSGSKDIRFANSFNEVVNLNIPELNDYVVQERISNGKDVIGAFFLCKDGNLISSYTHKRIRTFPKSGGVTVLSKISNDKAPIEIGTELLQKLNWNGFAMIEFLWDENVNKFKVIEINPRLWGSVLLSEFSGMNFINNYINLSLNIKIDSPNRRDNVMIRWLTFDILNIFSNLLNSEFWRIDKRNVCYINMTYSNFFSSLFFHAFYFFSLKNFKTLFDKWKIK